MKTTATTPVLEEEIYFTDDKFFGNGNDYPYDCKCFDGHASGTLCAFALDDDELMNAPKEIEIVYPKLADVLADDDKVHQVLNYRGLFDCTAEDITYGDIMIIFGKIKK